MVLVVEERTALPEQPERQTSCAPPTCLSVEARFCGPGFATARDYCRRRTVTWLVFVDLCQRLVHCMAAASRPSPPLPHDLCSSARLPVVRVVCALRAALHQYRHRHTARQHPRAGQSRVFEQLCRSLPLRGCGLGSSVVQFNSSNFIHSALERSPHRSRPTTGLQYLLEIRSHRCWTSDRRHARSSRRNGALPRTTFARLHKSPPATFGARQIPPPHLPRHTQRKPISYLHYEDRLLHRPLLAHARRFRRHHAMPAVRPAHTRLCSCVPALPYELPPDEPYERPDGLRVRFATNCPSRGPLF
jgi:hypothetical protein